MLETMRRLPQVLEALLECIVRAPTGLLGGRG